MNRLWHIFQPFSIKEMLSLARDPVLLFLIGYSFTMSVYTPAKNAVMDVVGASVAIVNEDNSAAARTGPARSMQPLPLSPARPPKSRSAHINKGPRYGQIHLRHRASAPVPGRPRPRREADRRYRHRRDGHEPGRWRARCYIAEDRFMPILAGFWRLIGAGHPVRTSHRRVPMSRLQTWQGASIPTISRPGSSPSTR